ncbi:MAG: aldo/keto reductase [Candidatus Atribacteria bacterium]|jgi:aryl-alcohol dehydrogenase-like predicted oxidoreductase|nr:aldo/keto reductase [Candidatus Atribacteria bacterium]
MKKNYLGKTGIKVTEMCFGALPLGPLQANISVEVGAKLIRTALEKGINFIDTAEVYQTYPYIKKALEGYNDEVIIATKSSAETYKKMEQSIKDALESLNRTYIDIFLLHAARVTPSVFEERAGALQCLKDYKSKGVVRAIGISTHAVGIVRRAVEIKEIDIVFPIINKLGMGIIGGSVDDMVKAISETYREGKGLYAMKALAGGHLINQLEESFNFVRNIKGISSIAVGMVNQEELELNLKIFNNEEISQELLTQKIKPGKRLFILSFCKGCGTCVKTCPNNALSLENGKAVVDHKLCILCGYCNPVCPEFAIRLI